MMSRAYRYASSPLSLHQAGALASPPGHRDRMNLAPPYDVLATRFVPLHDPNPDVTPTPPPAIFKDQLAVIRSFDRGTPRYRGFRCSCPPTPGRTHSLTDKLYPDAPSWQPFVLLGGLAAGDGCVASEDVMRLRAASGFVQRNWFPFHRHAVILHRDQASSNRRG